MAIAEGTAAGEARPPIWVEFAVPVCVARAVAASGVNPEKSEICRWRFSLGRVTSWCLGCVVLSRREVIIGRVWTKLSLSRRRAGQAAGNGSRRGELGCLIRRGGKSHAEGRQEMTGIAGCGGTRIVEKREVGAPTEKTTLRRNQIATRKTGHHGPEEMRGLSTTRDVVIGSFPPPRPNNVTDAEQVDD